MKDIKHKCQLMERGDGHDYGEVLGSVTVLREVCKLLEMGFS